MSGHRRSVVEEYQDLLGRGTAGWARCGGCGRAHFYPREYCPYCLSDEVRIEPLSATFQVRSFTRVYRPQRPTPAEIPILIIAARAEDVTIIAEGSGWHREECSIGASARLVTSGADRHVPVFVPADHITEA